MFVLVFKAIYFVKLHQLEQVITGMYNNNFIIKTIQFVKNFGNLINV